MEIGTDGNQPDSLTYLLEKSRGWTGLVIEPDSEKFESLMRLKRNSEFLQACLNVSLIVIYFNNELYYTFYN